MQSRLQILVVDDDPLLCEFIVMLFQKRLPLAQVLVALDGHHGLALFEHHRPQVVVSDYNMPGLDGSELTARIRAVDERVPIIMISGAELPKTVEGSSAFLHNRQLKQLPDVVESSLRDTSRPTEVAAPASGR